MYREQEWFDAFDFSFDMSVPNVAHLEPQRGGCCTVMPYFIGDVLELPLTTTQDYSLFHILGDYSTTLWKRQIRLIRDSTVSSASSRTPTTCAIVGRSSSTRNCSAICVGSAISSGCGLRCPPRSTRGGVRDRSMSLVRDGHVNFD